MSDLYVEAVNSIVMSAKEPIHFLRFTMLLTALAMVAACAWWIAINFQAQTGDSHGVADLFMDENLAANVPVVLRAELLELGHGSKYHWATVKVLDVLKNDTDDEFGGQLRLAHYGRSAVVPPGRSTIYLVRYNNDHPEYGWKLDESTEDSRVGFSHHVKYNDRTKR